MDCSNIFNDWFIRCNGLGAKIMKNFKHAFYSWLYSLQIINEIWTSKSFVFIVPPTFLFKFISRQEPTFPRWFYVLKKWVFLVQASWKLHEPSYAKPDECGLWVWESDKKLQSLARLLLSPNEWIDKYVRRMSSLKHSACGPGGYVRTY